MFMKWAWRNLASSVLAVFVTLSLNVHADAKQDAHQKALNTPAQNFQNHTFDPTSSLISRVQGVPPFVLDYLKELDKTDSYRNYTPTAEERVLIGEYLKLLPLRNQQTMQERLIGIYFVENFKGSGFTEYVVDEERNIYLLLILNPETLKTKMSKWMSFRENSAFQKDSDALTVQIECGDKHLGLLYVLLHESTHIVDYIYPITPYPEPSILEVRKNNPIHNNVFTQNIWLGYHKVEPKYIEDFTGKVDFYGLGGGAKLAISEAGVIYGELAKTPFASLYASQSWAEDLAELATWYHYTQVMRQPYKIIVSKNGKAIKTYEPMTNPLVRARIPVLEQLYR